jgi:hypothetical protein
MERNRRFIIVAAVLALSLSSIAQAEVIYVDDDATGLNNGSSWSDAYRFLQDALYDAAGASKPVEVWVAAGVYRPDRNWRYPDGTRSQNASFCLLDGVAVKGGFAGVEAPDPNARDIPRYETVLSGDLAGNDVPVGDPCDLLTEPTRAENSYHIVTAEPCSRSAVLEGFTIQGGNGGETLNEGGGLCLWNTRPCRPSIRNCTFTGNSARFGAAVCLYAETEPEFINCTFLQNAANWGGGAMAAVVGRSSYPEAEELVVRGCTFINNFVAHVGMRTPSVGGAIAISRGSASSIEGCVFARNRAGLGGAIYSVARWRSVNCCFIQNMADEAGGAIYVEMEGAETTVASSTTSANWAPNAQGCYAGAQARLSVINTILWDGGDEIGLAENALAEVTYSDVQGGWPGEGNIDADPLFANPLPLDPNIAITTSLGLLVYGDYHLRSQTGRWDPNSQSWVQDDVISPCIDAGDPNTPVGDEPEPNGGRINMGAYGGTAEASMSFVSEP